MLHVGRKLLLHVNWSARNPDYTIQQQLYVLHFSRADRSLNVQVLWENHSCRQSMVSLHANHTSQLFNHMIHIRSYSPPSESSVHLHLCIILKQNVYLTLYLLLHHSSILPVHIMYMKTCSQQSQEEMCALMYVQLESETPLNMAFCFM